jgi:cytochrome P450
VATEAPTTKIRAHVPPELVWDQDFDAFCEELDDPFLAASRMLDGPPIVWGTKVFFGKPAWILARHALIEEAFLHPELFSSRRNAESVEMLGGDKWRMIPVELDPPEHGKYRRILQPYFTPQSMRSMEPMVQETCDFLIARFANKGGCEFIEDFASRLPNMIFLSMMGMPIEMLDQFLDWEQNLIRAPDEEKRLQAAQAIMGYFMGFIAEQRKAPKTELMRIILGGEVDGIPLSEIDVLGTCFLLYVGGLDTVYSSLGWIFRHLAHDHALQERLRASPQDIPQAVEEFERAFPVARPTRTVVQDFTFHGAPLRKGDLVVLPTYIAGRDPAVYKNPHVVDIDRKARYITFATGPHICLGVHLAKREVRMVLESFLSRFRNIRIPAGESYEYHVGGVFGVDRLPLEWGVAE